MRSIHLTQMTHASDSVFAKTKLFPYLVIFSFSKTSNLELLINTII